MSAVSALPVPLVCSECGETGRTYYFSRTSRKLGFCRHCQPVNPRWRDWHTLPDERLLRPIQTWFYRRKRIDSDGHVQYPLHLGWLVILLARYALRHFHCALDGQCVFRAGTVAAARGEMRAMSDRADDVRDGLHDHPAP